MLRSKETHYLLGRLPCCWFCEEGRYQGEEEDNEMKQMKEGRIEGREGSKEGRKEESQGSKEEE